MKVTTNLLRAHIKRLQDEVEGDTEQIRSLEESVKLNEHTLQTLLLILRVAEGSSTTHVKLDI
jgi:hypothetical protein